MSVSRILLIILLACASLHAETSHDGGRDLTVVLFSTRQLHTLTLTPLGADAWTSSCDGCAHKPLIAPMQVSGVMELFAGGPLRATDQQSHEQRSAAGRWHLRSNADGIDVVLTLPSERYVAAVLNAEANADEPAESLRALAIVARTYALNGSHYTAAPGHLPADTCDSTQCQAMRPGTTSAAIDEAVRDTAGETLWFRGKQATVFFSEHCGGMTEDASAVWPQVHGVPYLHSHVDPYCLRRGPAAWHAEIPLKDFVPIAAAQGWHLPQPVLAVRVLDRSSSHRPLRVEFTGASSATAVVDARALRFAIDRALGWNRIRSGQFNLAVRYGVIVFDGRGYGHGVGLCQTGATEMAAGHKTAQQIIAFYFPGTSIGIGRDDSGWLTVQRGPITVRSTEALPPAKLDDIEQIWGRALQRFPPRRTVAPEIVFAPSVEIFRQLTAQPGWVAASTSGSRIVLEPMRTLQASSDTTVLHEMLHVLVESEASERAPLWLREGLVAELAGEPRAPTITMPAIAIEAALRNAASQSEDEHAHRQAAARVHALIARYGLSSVRGWLVSSVPPGVA